MKQRYIAAMHAALLLFCLGCFVALTGCATPADQTRKLLDRLEFDSDEHGTFALEGTVDINPLPLFSTNLHLKLEKTKPESAVKAKVSDPAPI